MTKDKLIEHIVSELESNGWAVNEDYYKPIVSDVIEIIEETGKSVVDKEVSFKGVF